MTALAGLHLLPSGAMSVALVLAIAWVVTVVCLTVVRVRTARRAWRRARNVLVRG